MPTPPCDCSAAARSEPLVDTRATNALCPRQAPPRVAVCIAGAIRTFAQEQAWRSLKRNLVEAFGGVGLAAPAPDVFMQLKLVDDAPKGHREWRFDTLSHRLDGPHSEALCRAVCAFHPVGLELGNASHAGPARPAAVGRGCFSTGFFGQRENLLRAVSQWASFAACHERIAAHEEQIGRAYDLVMLTRPDTVWYTAVRPHCLHATPYGESGSTTIHRGPLRWNSTLEWLLLMPRAHAAHILTSASLFDSCERGQSCCAISRSEDLLAFVLGRTGRWRHEPFGVDILRAPQHAAMRNAGCMQPEALGFRSFEHCRAIMYGMGAPAAVGAHEPPSRTAPVTAPARSSPQRLGSSHPPGTTRHGVHTAHARGRDHDGHKLFVPSRRP